MTTIGQHQWHKLSNRGDEDLHIVEIQYGEKCEEEDIERAD
jgi:mannose-6-phosphate isomerase-like protein (cupin superfamily)